MKIGKTSHATFPLAHPFALAVGWMDGWLRSLVGILSDELVARNCRRFFRRDFFYEQYLLSHQAPVLER